MFQPDSMRAELAAVNRPAGPSSLRLAELGPGDRRRIACRDNDACAIFEQAGYSTDICTKTR
jgi:hypothetical protein